MILPLHLHRSPPRKVLRCYPFPRSSESGVHKGMVGKTVGVYAGDSCFSPRSVCRYTQKKATTVAPITIAADHAIPRLLYLRAMSGQLT
jgi:hypothetical protein